jgi:hypothetical protein
MEAVSDVRLFCSSVVALLSHCCRIVVALLSQRYLSETKSLAASPAPSKKSFRYKQKSFSEFIS